MLCLQTCGSELSFSLDSIFRSLPSPLSGANLCILLHMCACVRARARGACEMGKS